MKRTLLALVLASAFAPAWAARPIALPEDLDFDVAVPNMLLAAGPESAEAWKRWSEDFTNDLQSSMGVLFSARMGSGKVVKGAPYSAELVTETNQTLADGNVITHRTSGRVYRDAEGRTRQETDAQGRRARVFIDDPVAGKHIVLTPDAQTAVVMPRVSAGHGELTRSKQVVKDDGTEVRVEDGKVFINEREVPGGNARVKLKNGKEVKVENGRVWIDGKEIGSGDGPGTHTRVGVTREVVDGVPRQEVRVNVVRIGDDDLPPPPPPLPPVPPVPGVAPPPPLPPIPPIPGVQTMRFESTAGLGKGVATRLGTKEFDGVKAEGTSTVWTIPAGRIGNRGPINVTKESWYSPELQLVVYSRHNDPRAGESVYRLASIKRAEPAAELFQVPESYATRKRERRGAAPEAKAPNSPR